MNELRELVESLFSEEMTVDEIKKSLESFAQYDLKEQFPFDSYQERTVFGKKYVSSMLKGDKTRAYFCYKALTIEDKHGEFCDRAPSLFDPDNSSGKCDFARELYTALWGFEYAYSSFGEMDSFPKKDNKVLLWGGDCLNSLQTSIHSLTGYSKYACLKKMAEQEEDFVDEMNNSIISPMFAVSHAPGNFGLVPAYYNCHRGTSGLIHDYLPQSLFFLKTTDKEDFSIVKKLSAYTRNSEYKNGMANEYFQEYSNSMFPKYINTMFFWDLVKPGDDGELTIIDYAGNAIDELSGEFEESDLKMWAQGSELFIKRRGMFIAALLYAYYFYNSEFEEIKKLLFIDETITVDNKYGYEAVFRLIEKSITNVNVKLVFKCVEDLFKEKK